MYLVIGSVYDGTWASGPWPEELVIAEVLLETGWSWRQWLATPAYMQRVVVDVIEARRRRDQDEADQQRSQHEAAMRRQGR